MTVQSEIIEPALRLLNIEAKNNAFELADLTFALDAYNPIQRALLETVGVKLMSVVAPASTSVINGGEYHITGAGVTLTLPPSPKDGSRFGVTLAPGASGTLNANGYKIDTAVSLPAASGRWFFRADLGAWTKEVDQALGDAVIFPRDLHEFLIAMTATKAAAGYGEGNVLAPTTKETANAGVGAFQARYGRPRRAA